MNRRTFVALAAAACLPLAACTGPTSPAEPTTLTIALPGGDADPRHAAVADWAQGVSDATDGRATITITTEADDSAAVAAGTASLAFVDGDDLAERNGDFEVFNLPYTFDSAAAQASVLGDAEVTGDLYGSLEADGLIVLGGGYGGARNLLSTQRAITTPTDVQGQRIRVGQSPDAVRIIEAFGGVAVPLVENQVTATLNSGGIQGVEGTLFDFESLGLAAGTFVGLTHHQLVPDYLVANAAALDGLSRADREALTDSVPGLITAANEAVAAAEAEARASAEAAGAAYNEVEPLAFEATVDPIGTAVVTTPARQALYDAASAR